MTLLGVDFTSAPSHHKPITAVIGRLEGDLLVIDETHALTDWPAFEAFLNRPGPWVGGFDLPLGMPAPLREHFGLDGPALARAAHEMGVPAWVERLRAYRGPTGEKERFRRCDRLAGAQSPMKCFYIPVGRMYATGAGRIRAAGVRIAAQDPPGGDRIAVEVYPALAAEKLGGSRSYKTDTPKAATPERLATHRERRLAIIRGLARPNAYGVTVTLDDEIAEQSGADRLDAVLALVQTAWTAEKPNFGAPIDADPFEGWIHDPALVDKG